MESIRALGIDVETLEIEGPPKIKYLWAVRELRSRVKAFDVVHAHFGFSAWVALAQGARPVVASFMGGDLMGARGSDGRLTYGSRLARRINQGMARRVDAVIVKSEEMARALPGVPSHVIPNGVDLDVFVPQDRSSVRARLGWPDATRVALFAGCPAFPNKGYELARDSLTQAERLLGETVDLKVLWNVDPDQVPLLIAAADALVLASFQEGSPNVVKEALSCETPVVATAVGDVPELLRDVPGCHVAPREPDKFGRALASALSFGRLSEGRRTLRAKHLEMEQVARKVAAVYQSVLRSAEARV
jgi:glycosyltransferase involved in cell wall biosynthesis